MELIDREHLQSTIRNMVELPNEVRAKVLGAISRAKAVDAVEVPCKIGDFVWAIRRFHGHKHPQRGVVSDMLFTGDMKLQIVVKYVARGEWGKTVFATDKEAYAAIGVPCCPNCGAKMDGGAEDGK